ncbi:hypothetical protein N7492_008203 [Penicillium capsulatum]|uniref:Uncharacterized protein n=1 Tax=Penicillium capsulatum TaxID=69766 RepID=A0A9W9HSK8_9EURO|nr:hypothetical protein N7492_008203 [Penicillium capsulatum]KAJ6105613.1 hypothetical protein N7512_009130 [Penicillium capsulatum]
MLANRGPGRLGLLVAVLAVVRCGAAQFCSFWDSSCIDPLAQSAVRMDFSPLFQDPITFYYAFDASPSGKGEGPMTKTAFWLRYNDHRVKTDPIDENRTSEVALRVGNLTGTPSGANNGCDGFLGPRCSDNIKSALQTLMYRHAVSDDSYAKPLEYALNQLLSSSSSSISSSCATAVLDVASIPVQEFAVEQTSNHNTTLMTPGSPSDPWQVWYLDQMTAHQQANQVAVGIISRGPSHHSTPQRPSDFQIELVCVQAPNSRQGSSSKGAH